MSRDRRSRTVSRLLAALLACSFVGASREPTELEVKAAFLYHFAQLVTWPEPANVDPAAPVVIGVVGRDPFGDRLEETIGRELVRGRPLRIVRAATAVDLVPAPQILFVGAGDLAEVSRSLAALGNAPVLTVGSVKGFAQQGGMIEFRVTADSRVAFDINVVAVEASGLKMSSQLLKIARIVRAAR